jgi:hypothetical protein
MASFGVCENTEKRCSLSFESEKLSQLLTLIAALEQRQLSGGDGNSEPELECYRRFYQEQDSCRQCRGALIKSKQVTAGLQPDSEEYLRRTRINEILEAEHKLRAIEFHRQGRQAC